MSDSNTQTFKQLHIGDQFDFIGPRPGYNSFFDRCEKVATRTYRSVDTGLHYCVGSITATVYHVTRKQANQ